MSDRQVNIVGRNGTKASVTEKGALVVQLGDKLNRIINSPDYTQAFTYYTGTSNVITITHTGTTQEGVEVVTQTITYVDPSVSGSNVTQIQNS